MLPNKQKTITTLMAAGVPPARAEKKAADSIVGWVLVGFGVLLWLVATGIAGMLVWQRAAVGPMLLALAGLPAGLGFLLFGAGMHLIAREGTPSPMQALVDLLVKLVRGILLRGTT